MKGYERRYRIAHRAARMNAIDRVALNDDWAICPFCLRPTHIYRVTQRTRHMQAHHTDYNGSSELPVCSACHVPKLHNRFVWKVSSKGKDDGHNMPLFACVIRSWVCLVAFTIRFIDWVSTY